MEKVLRKSIVTELSTYGEPFHLGAFLTLLLGALGIGFAPILAKLGVSEGHISPIGVGAWRMLVGSLGFGTLLCLSPRRIPILPPGRSVPRLVGAFFWPGFFFAGDLLTWHTSFEYTSIANASLLANVAAVLVPLVSWIFFKERLSKIFILGACMAFSGVVMLVYLGAPNVTSITFFGDGLALVTALSYSGYMLTTKRLTMRVPTQTLMLWTSGISGLLLLLVCIFFNQDIWPRSTIGYVYVVALGLISQVFGQGLVALSMKRLDVGFSTVTLLLAPVASSLLGVLILGQPINSWQIAGGATVLAGVGLVSRAQIRRNFTSSTAGQHRSAP